MATAQRATMRTTSTTMARRGEDDNKDQDGATDDKVNNDDVNSAMNNDINDNCNGATA